MESMPSRPELSQRSDEGWCVEVTFLLGNQRLDIAYLVRKLIDKLTMNSDYSVGVSTGEPLLDVMVFSNLEESTPALLASISGIWDAFNDVGVRNHTILAAKMWPSDMDETLDDFMDVSLHAIDFERMAQKEADNEQ